VGREHNYSSYGGIVAGVENRILAPFASVTGGADRGVEVSWGTRRRGAAMDGAVIEDGRRGQGRASVGSGGGKGEAVEEPEDLEETVGEQDEIRGWERGNIGKFFWTSG
jgi:hypothetical protein